MACCSGTLSCQHADLMRTDTTEAQDVTQSDHLRLFLAHQGAHSLALWFSHMPRLRAGEGLVGQQLQWQCPLHPHPPHQRHCRCAWSCPAPAGPYRYGHLIHEMENYSSQTATPQKEYWEHQDVFNDPCTYMKLTTWNLHVPTLQAQRMKGKATLQLWRYGYVMQICPPRHMFYCMCCQPPGELQTKKIHETYVRRG